jgi:hypothetical protein
MKMQFYITRDFDAINLIARRDHELNKPADALPNAAFMCAVTLSNILDAARFAAASQSEAVRRDNKKFFLSNLPSSVYPHKS